MVQLITVTFILKLHILNYWSSIWWIMVAAMTLMESPAIYL